MSLNDALDRYFAGWNDHDAAAVVASLAADGTFEDPTSHGQRSGNALGQYVAELVIGFPDVHFDVVSVAATGENELLGLACRKPNPFGSSVLVSMRRV